MRAFRLVYLTYPYRERPRQRVSHRRNPDGIELSIGQKRAMINIFEALERADRTALVLAGPAGTGKTTLMRAVIEELDARGINTVLLAPTGKAASRLRETTGKETSTIHKFIFVAPATLGVCPVCGEKSSDLAISPVAMRREGHSEYQCPACRTIFPLSTVFKRTLGFEQRGMDKMPLGRHVVIVDEASMVGKGLARKLETSIPESYRILYVGDREQLPPVTEPGEQPGWGPTFDAPTAVLTEIHRQAAGNPIIQLATRLRTDENKDNPFLISDDPNVLPADGLKIVRGGGLKYAASWCTAMLYAKKSAILIAFGNQTVLDLNNHMRGMLEWGGKSLAQRSVDERTSFVRGDYMLIAANNPAADLMNGEIVRVNEVKKPPASSKMAEARMILVTIEHPRRGSKQFVVFNALEAREAPGRGQMSLRPIYKIRADVLREAFDEPAKSSTARYRAVEKAATPDRNGNYDSKAAALLDEYSQLTPLELYEQAETVRPGDLLCATYGLAITGHKSQGSQWQEVGVVWESYMNDWWNDHKRPSSGDLSRYETMRRWLYTAITRAQQETVLFDTSAAYSTLVRSYGVDGKTHPPARSERVVAQAMEHAARETPPAPPPSPAEVRQLQSDAADRTVPVASQRAVPPVPEGSRRWGLKLPAATSKKKLAQFNAPLPEMPEPITDAISVSRLLDRADEHGRKFILVAYAAMVGRQTPQEQMTRAASKRNAIGWSKSDAENQGKYDALIQGVREKKRGPQKYMALVLNQYREQLANALASYTPNPRRRR
jgi:hypothetical protein